MIIVIIIALFIKHLLKAELAMCLSNRKSWKLRPFCIIKGKQKQAQTKKKLHQRSLG